MSCMILGGIHAIVATSVPTVDQQHGPVSSSGPANYLEISRRDADSVWLHPLHASRTVIGRAEDAEICLDHSTVSRHHAELVRGPYGHWWVHDLGSTNGTYVNGDRSAERLLRPGDVIDVGSFSLVMRAPARGSRRGLDFDDRPPMSDDATVVMSSVDIVAPIAGTPLALSSGQLSKVIALGRTLLMFDDPIKRLTHACEFMVGEDFPADRAAVLGVESGVPRDVVCGPVRRVDHDKRPIYYSRGVIKTMWDLRSAVVGHSGGPSADPRGGLRRSAGVPVKKLSNRQFSAPVAVMALPLSSWAEEMSCMYLELSPEHATSEWLALASFIAGSCEQAELASEMRYHGRIAAFVERELDMARQIQDGLLPRALRFDGLDTAFRYDPCRWVGGDYVDVMPLADGRVLLAIADVCGKGLQAALVASSLHTMVRSTADKDATLAELMTRFNGYFSSYLPDHSFVTMIGLVLDPHTGELEFANAGHPAGLIVSTTGEVRELASTNPALGMMNARVDAQRVVLAKDEIVVLYTDGLTEASNEEGDAYGVDRLADSVRAALAANENASADQLCDAIGKSIEAHQKAHMDLDDRAWVVARRV